MKGVCRDGKRGCRRSDAKLRGQRTWGPTAFVGTVKSTMYGVDDHGRPFSRADRRLDDLVKIVPRFELGLIDRGGEFLERNCVRFSVPKKLFGR